METESSLKFPTMNRFFFLKLIWKLKRVLRLELGRFLHYKIDFLSEKLELSAGFCLKNLLFSIIFKFSVDFSAKFFSFHRKIWLASPNFSSKLQFLGKIPGFHKTMLYLSSLLIFFPFPWRAKMHFSYLIVKLIVILCKFHCRNLIKFSKRIKCIYILLFSSLPSSINVSGKPQTVILPGIFYISFKTFANMCT